MQPAPLLQPLLLFPNVTDIIVTISDNNIEGDDAMYNVEFRAAGNEEFYQLLHARAEILYMTETDALANLSNTAALIYLNMPEINWVGFYLWRDKQLILGPFQGKPACTRILPGQGVCGTAAASGDVLLVPDVHEFPGHIACDSASLSELVIPFSDTEGNFLGVLDIDAPIRERFSVDDIFGMVSLLDMLIAASDWRRLL